MNSQLSLYEQLCAVRESANKDGFYDAADFLAKIIKEIEEKEE